MSAQQDYTSMDVSQLHLKYNYLITRYSNESDAAQKETLARDIETILTIAGEKGEFDAERQLVNFKAGKDVIQNLFWTTDIQIPELINWDEALALMIKLPENEQNHAFAGDVYYTRKDYPNAIEAYGRSNEFRSPSVTFNMGMAYANMGPEYIQQTLAALVRCVDNYGHYIEIGGVARPEMLEAAAEEITKIIEGVPSGSPTLRAAFKNAIIKMPKRVRALTDHDINGPVALSLFALTQQEEVSSLKQ